MWVGVSNQSKGAASSYFMHTPCTKNHTIPCLPRTYKNVSYLFLQRREGRCRHVGHCTSDYVSPPVNSNSFPLSQSKRILLCAVEKKNDFFLLVFLLFAPPLGLTRRSNYLLFMLCLKGGYEGGHLVSSEGHVSEYTGDYQY